MLCENAPSQENDNGVGECKIEVLVVGFPPLSECISDFSIDELIAKFQPYTIELVSLRVEFVI